MGHIRYATVGNVGYTNCHPFVQTDSSGREWVFFHNGTMFRGELVADYAHVQIGTTDSERILLYLMDRINEATEEKGTLSCLEHFRILSQAADLSRGNNKLNLLIYNGHTLFVHTNMEGTLFQKKIDGGYVFATSPLDRDGDWQQVPMRRMLAYRDGILLYEGEPISEEYFFRQADIDRLYQVFSEL
jgi:glutamine amidotransferase